MTGLAWQLRMTSTHFIGGEGDVTEQWKDVPGYEGIYQVSNLGRVRSVDRVIIDRNGRPMRYKGVILTPQFNEFGYLKVVLRKDGRSKNFKVHQLVAMAFIENPNGLPCINHIDGNKQNNKVTNLEWCTFGGNNKHAYLIGLKIPYERDGEKNPKAKFTDEEAEIIRSLHKYNGGPFGTMYLARKYGVHKDTITNLIRMKTYVKDGVG